MSVGFEDAPEVLSAQESQIIPADNTARNKFDELGLRVIDGRGESEPPVQELSCITARCVEVEIFDEGKYKGRNRRVDELTLSNGHVYYTVVSEPHQDAVEEHSNITTLVDLRGLLEIPTAKRSTANNRHNELAKRLPGKRIVSADRRGFSTKGPMLPPWTALAIGMEKRQSIASDHLEISQYYSEGNPIELFTVSAGRTTCTDMLNQNAKAPTEKQIRIAKIIYSVVPLQEAKNIPTEVAKFRPENEPDLAIRAKLAGKFIIHTLADTVESGVKNPRDTINSMGIVTTVIMRPWMAPTVLAHFLRHTEGIDFDDITDALDHPDRHLFKELVAGKDPLEGAAQHEVIDKMYEGRIERIRLPSKGHISTPIDIAGTLDALGIDNSSTATETTPSGIFEAGKYLAAGSLKNLGNLAVKPGKSMATFGRLATSRFKKFAA